MKIYHCLADDGQRYYGELCEDDPERLRILDGGLFTSWTPSAVAVKIKKFLPLFAPPNIFALGLTHLRQ